MYCYDIGGHLAASLLPGLPLEPAQLPACGFPPLFLLDRDPHIGRAAWRATDPRAADCSPGGGGLAGRGPSAPRLFGLDPSGTGSYLGRRGRCREHLPSPLADALDFLRPRAGKKRVHLLAVGDVGGTLLTALKLIGGDVISSIGICDLNQNTVARWTAEMGQISWPWDYGALPEVEPVEPARLFDCECSSLLPPNPSPPWAAMSGTCAWLSSPPTVRWWSPSPARPGRQTSGGFSP